MEFRKLFLVMSLCLLYICNCFADSFDEDKGGITSFLYSSRVINNKVYIEPENIYVASDQILVNFDGDLLPIQNLSTDENGVFVFLEEVLRAAEEKEETWRCRRCGRINIMEDRWCARCGRHWNER